MKAICVTALRGLEVREVPEPRDPPPGHLVVRIEAAAINHGDKTFLARPEVAGLALAGSLHDIWGASAAGDVTAAGPGVPDDYVGRRVAIYRSIGGGADMVGLWCETAQVPYTACLRLPDGVDAREYSGSLVNIITAYASLETAAADGHRGVVATAGNSATGYALAALARSRGTAALILVRSPAAQTELERHGIENVVVVDDQTKMEAVGERVAALEATAVFDGVGGGGLSRLLPHLSPRSTIYAYGFLAGPEPVSFPSTLLMSKDLTLRRFSNFDTPAVRDPQALENAMRELEAVVGDPLFRTRIGRSFALDAVDAAMNYETSSGTKAMFIF